jgi:hypothetical protein
MMIKRGVPDGMGWDGMDVWLFFTSRSVVDHLFLCFFSLETF